MYVHCSDVNKTKIKSWDQVDQDQAKIYIKTGAVLNHSPASACRIRQCDKLQQVVQFKASPQAYSSTAINVSS